MKTLMLKEIFTIACISYMVLSCSQSKNELYSKNALPALADHEVSKSRDEDIHQDEYRILTGKGKTEYIKVLKSFSWFSQKEASQQKEIIRNIEKDTEVKYAFLTLGDMSFDTEGLESAESYQNILNEFIKVAGVQQQIRNIQVSEQNNLINITILTTNNDELHYTVDINKNQDWIDSDFDQFINNQLLPKTNTDKKFFGLPAVDQVANLIFISQKDFDTAKKIGLIPTDDVFME